jgi:hypothetical protein
MWIGPAAHDNTGCMCIARLMCAQPDVRAPVPLARAVQACTTRPCWCTSCTFAATGAFGESLTRTGRQPPCPASFSSTCAQGRPSVSSRTFASTCAAQAYRMCPGYRAAHCRVRGLAHPGHWAGPLGPWFEAFGAVKASPMAAFKLLKAKQKVLLFPGGARWGLHSLGVAGSAVSSAAQGMQPGWCSSGQPRAR